MAHWSHVRCRLSVEEKYGKGVSPLTALSSMSHAFQHNYLSSLLPRMGFSVGIFHAYGHKWSCQVEFNPRKCNGFGRSNGEGSERLWNQDIPLIGPMRNAGVRFTLPPVQTALMCIRSIIVDVGFLMHIIVIGWSADSYVRVFGSRTLV